MQEYNVSVMLMWNAFLVDIVPRRDGRVLKLNKLDTKTWEGNDVLIFNTWHHWLYTGRKQPYVRLINLHESLHYFYLFN